MATFEEALKCMREGKKVKLKTCTREYWYIENGVLRGFNIKDNYSNTYPLALYTILSEDWEVVEDDNK